MSTAEAAAATTAAAAAAAPALPAFDANLIEFVLCSQRVVLDSSTPPAPRALYVVDGRVAAVVNGGADVAATLAAAHGGATLVDVGDQLVMPAVVDSHVHVNEPGRDWEGFATATRAAAAGGVGTIADMPLNSSPVTTSLAAMRRKVAAAEGKLHVDVALLGGVVPGNSAEIAKMAAAGVAGFKCFMVHSGIDEFPAVGEAELQEAFAAFAALPPPAPVFMFHAEDPAHVAEPAAGADPRDYATFLATRPPACERAAVETVARLAKAHDGKVRCHIVHVAAADVVPVLRDAQRDGVPLSGELTYHNLHLSAERVPSGATLFKCVPPIRSDANREALWAALRDGTIGQCVSDHSPCTPSLKLPDKGDFVAAWGGIASLSLGLSIVWTEARARGIAVTDVVRWLCEAPAALLGFAGRKGALRVGCDADIVVWDDRRSFVVDEAQLEIRHKKTPYSGETLFGVPLATFVRGRLAFDAAVAPPAGPVYPHPRGQLLLHKREQ